MLREAKYGENIAGATGFFSAGAFVDVVGAEAGTSFFLSLIEMGWG